MVKIKHHIINKSFQNLPVVATNLSLYMDGVNDIVDTPNTASTSNQRLIHPNANQKFTILFLCRFEAIKSGQWNTIYRYNADQFVASKGFEIAIRQGASGGEIGMVWGNAFTRFSTANSTYQSIYSNDVIQTGVNYLVVITMPTTDTFGTIQINTVDETATHVNGGVNNPDSFNSNSRLGIGCHPNFGTSASHYSGYQQPEWYISHLTAYWGWIGQNNVDIIADLIVNQGVFPDLDNPAFYENYLDDAPSVWSWEADSTGHPTYNGTQKPVPMTFMTMQTGTTVDDNGWLNTPRLNNGALITSQDLMP